MSEDIQTLFRRYINEVWNAGNLSAAGEFIAPTVLRHTPSQDFSGLDGEKQFFNIYYTAFPVQEYTIEDLFTDGNKAVARWTLKATHGGNLMGIPATGKKVTVSAVTIARFANEKIEEIWSFWDTLSMLQQLGISPLVEK
ncbi:ester cyclase [Synechococcus sp. PCC 7336]|uniref:ester cyclase n=1 Tax=Synechococcus sp. PCC 7336 TaxID=195250 RepID=UPI00034D6A50|nr:ester cyclase [Synechococcus sp. PCC 7336]